MGTRHEMLGKMFYAEGGGRLLDRVALLSLQLEDSLVPPAELILENTTTLKRR